MSRKKHEDEHDEHDEHPQEDAHEREAEVETKAKPREAPPPLVLPMEGSINEPQHPSRSTVLGGSINEPVSADDVPDPPRATGMDPTSVPAGWTGLALTVTGTGFLPSTAVTFNGIEVPTTVVQEGTEVVADVPDEQLVAAGAFPVALNFGSGPAMMFTVTEVADPEADPELETAEDDVDESDPDEMEDEIERAIEDGEIERGHKPPRSKRKHK